MSGYIFTSESVTEGHPDKISDQISDAILDALLEVDPNSRVACETLVKTGYINLAGEITTKAHIDYAAIARKTVREIGYTSSEMGFDADTCAVLVAIDAQSPDIAQGVNEGEGDYVEQGAGDQGLIPSNFVEIVVDVPAPAAPQPPPLEEEPWFHAGLKSRQQAEQLLKAQCVALFF